MENKEATRNCSHCCREVAETNYTLHEMHCKRFLCLCPECEELIPRELLSQHREEEHSQVKCSKCNQRMQRCHQLIHEMDECTERLLCCTYCDLQLPHKDMHEHSLACGSRTNKCKDCGRYVTLRDWPAHGSTCVDADADRPQMAAASPHLKKTCESRDSKASFPAEENELKFIENSSVQEVFDEYNRHKQGDSLKAVTRSNTLEMSGDPHEISSCPHCHLALPRLTLHWHVVKCQTHFRLKQRSDH